jgi:UDP-N-acetylmuramoylalanine-D-glutamate ligase
MVEVDVHVSIANPKFARDVPEVGSYYVCEECVLGDVERAPQKIVTTSLVHVTGKRGGTTPTEIANIELQPDRDWET